MTTRNQHALDLLLTGMHPADVAERVDLSRGAVSAIAYRARADGLAVPRYTNAGRPMFEAERTCPRCAFVAKNAQGLACHMRQAHGTRSTHPKTVANRLARLTEAPLIEVPDGPVALLEAVILVARYDARNDSDAQEWLRDIRQIRRAA